MYLVSRTETFAKLFFIVSFTGLFMYVALAFYSFHTAYSTVSQISGYQDRFGRIHEITIENFPKDLKYILIWAVSHNTCIPEGQTMFFNSQCPDVNCYLTTNKSALEGNYTNFDAIVFNLTVLSKWFSPLLPKHRSPHQKYVFYSKQASADNPICNVVVNNYFNWTWTYKFGSTIFSPFIQVKDLDGNVIAPSNDVVWKNSIQPFTNIANNIDEVNTKTKAVAWIINDCSPMNKVIISIRRLQKALEEHALALDIYGCGNLECPPEGCLTAIERDYYFYLAYEHSISEQYVTDEVLKGYHHDAVPIVIGGADYTKFLPDNSYINYQGFTEEKLAVHIAYTIRNPSKYREYFNWKKQYSILKVEEHQGYCQLCYLLNNERQVNEFSSYNDFRKWWYNGSLREKCLPKGAEKYSEVLSYSNSTHMV